MTRSSSPCRALTKKGKPCRAAATSGGLCFFHANPNKASELGRIGGRSKTKFLENNSEPLPPLHSVLAVRDAVDRLIADVYAGKLHPRIATGLAPLLHLQLRVLDATDMEGRLSKLEQIVSKPEQSPKRNGGKNQFKFGTGLTPSGAPLVGRHSEKESESRFATKAEPVAAPTAENAPVNSPEPRAPEAESKLDINNVEEQVPGDNLRHRRIQDGAARALQAEEEAQAEGRVGLRIQDAAGRAATKAEEQQAHASGVGPPIDDTDARALPEKDSDPRPTNGKEQVPAEPQVQTPTDNSAQRSERGSELGLEAGTEEAAAENDGAGSTNTAALTDQEKLEQAIREAWKHFPPKLF